MKILLIGPFPEPIHGNSIANQVLEKGLIYNGINVKTIDMATNLSEKIGSFSFSKTYSAFIQYFSLYKVFWTNVVYLTPGQSFLGVFKYAPFILLGYILRRNIVIHIHGNHLWKEYENASRLKKKIMYWLISRASKGIVLSESLRKNLTPFLPEENINCVFNFAENHLHSNKYEKDFNSLKIVFLSNLMSEKGIFDLLDALQIISVNKIKFEAKLAGGIDELVKEQVLSKISALGNNVTYLGLIRGQEKKELLEWGNVFIFTTYYHIEGQPIALLEAMATANSIITTRHAGIPDILSEQNAFFVTPKSPKQIAKILTTFETNKKDFITKSEFNLMYSKKFTEKAYVENILKVIET